MRALKKTSALSEWAIERFVMRNPKVRVKIAGMLGRVTTTALSRIDSFLRRALELLKRERYVCS